MIFLDIPIPAQSELGEEILKHFTKHKFSFEKSELIEHIQKHQLYFQNKPIGFLPFKVFKKGKAQLYLNHSKIQNTWEIQKTDILFEDKWLIVLNKPSGVPSQSSLRFLQNHAFSSTICLLRERKPFTSPTLFLMHRLDVDTSGVLLMTKKSSANKGIQNLFEKKQIQKTYWAVSKDLSSDQTDKGSQNQKPLPEIVKSYLGKKPDKHHKFKFASFPKGHPQARYAETHFKQLSSKDGYNLFQVQPQTGRSHQIRVHMSENGHPIVGDPFYNRGDLSSPLLLHAKSLSFIHPQTQEKIHIEAPLPSHWQSFEL